MCAADGAADVEIPTPRIAAEALLTALRAGGSERAAAAALLARADSSALRANVVLLLAAALQPRDARIVRQLLAAETAALVAAGHGASETLFTLVAAVARYADPADTLLLWRARQATAETRAGVDVEHLARAGVDRVRAHLATLQRQGGAVAAEAAAAAAWFEDGIAAGAANDLPGYFAWADERFGLTVSGPT